MTQKPNDVKKPMAESGYSSSLETDEFGEETSKKEEFSPCIYPLTNISFLCFVILRISYSKMREISPKLAALYVDTITTNTGFSRTLPLSRS